MYVMYVMYIPYLVFLASRCPEVHHTTPHHPGLNSGCRVAIGRETSAERKRGGVGAWWGVASETTTWL